MDRDELLARFDAEVRAQLEVRGGDRVERVGSIVRVIGGDCWISFSQLDRGGARIAIEAEVRYFRSLQKWTFAESHHRSLAC
ncbi:MAG: hypothetical protein ACREC5_07745 [Thermoplasmata archaeon]